MNALHLNVWSFAQPGATMGVRKTLLFLTPNVLFNRWYISQGNNFACVLNYLEIIFVRFTWNFKIWKKYPGALPRYFSKIWVLSEKCLDVFFWPNFLAQHPVTVPIKWEPPKVIYRPSFISLQNISRSKQKATWKSDFYVAVFMHFQTLFNFIKRFLKKMVGDGCVLPNTFFSSEYYIVVFMHF